MPKSERLTRFVADQELEAGRRADSAISLNEELDEMFGSRRTSPKAKAVHQVSSTPASASASASDTPSASTPAHASSSSSSTIRRVPALQSSDAADFATVLRKAGEGKAGVSGEDFLRLLSSYVQRHAADLRSGVLHLSLNTPCLSHLSACISQQRNEEILNRNQTGPSVKSDARGVEH